MSDAALRALLAAEPVPAATIIDRARGRPEWRAACAFLDPTTKIVFRSKVSRFRLENWLRWYEAERDMQWLRAMFEPPAAPAAAPARLGDTALWADAADRLVAGDGR